MMSLRDVDQLPAYQPRVRRRSKAKPVALLIVSCLTFAGVAGLAFGVFQWVRDTESHEKAVKAVQRVAEQHNKVLAEDLPSDEDFQKYVDFFDRKAYEFYAIDTTACPDDFREAFENYRRAFRKFARAVDKFPKSGKELFFFGVPEWFKGKPDGGLKELFEAAKAAEDELIAAADKLASVLPRYRVQIRLWKNDALRANRHQR